ncbi:sugar isomerase [Curtobacterium sp. MCJR17_055]|uniref:SIS domain-containing protein n=1 Tax=unclassified Curtobacterium TaxID=257496 RepID=UPI000D9698F1|nr:MULTISPECIES: SIS domain-containing protein [unclassified Curtobacterium]PYY37772.1 sugar isomerase [Curtobacterium sp. MCBD17_029]PYY41451.1 sugar isomerase [Curtobacterium sp. MCPF17_046]PYY56800.1 sugar isomerase [Curtobacterium sp. MCJR17_055]PYY62285.1 sugar isomerase [Curtobacterium sp. MCPF17_015]WIB35962.1 SIS domain-containing protein [Curtobacterium sp. MCJR17_043]
MSDTFVGAELASQPDSWRSAAALLPSFIDVLPQPGERVAVIGCGTSWFIAMSYAVARESAGLGQTDAFAGSEYPVDRQYDRVVTISRSGTTTEIIDLLRALPEQRTVLITAVPDSPAAADADAVVALPFADERSVVQTRFATTALALLRASLGDDVERLADQAETALTLPIDDLLDAEQVTFVGRGAAVGLTAEAALKTREAAQFWAESYPAMDYRHGPIAIAQPGRLVWSLGAVPDGLADEVAATGARLVHHDLDPLAGLVVVHRFAVALAERRGLDPDHPRSLTRSVILT